MVPYHLITFPQHSHHLCSTDITILEVKSLIFQNSFILSSNQPVDWCIHCLAPPGLEQWMPATGWGSIQSAEQRHMITQAVSSVTEHNQEFWFPNLVYSGHMPPSPAHRQDKGSSADWILDPQKGRAHLRRADANMTVQQVMAHLNVLNGVLEQTLQEEEFKWSERLTHYWSLLELYLA